MKIMENYKKEFIDFMVRCEVLKFGSFTLKSGRQSPFFMNAGAYVTGSQLMKLGEYYVRPSMRILGMILMSFLDQHTKGFRCLLQQSLHIQNYMARKSVIALTVRR